MTSAAREGAERLAAMAVLENLCAFFTPLCGAAFLLVLIGAAIFRYPCSASAHGAGRIENNQL